ncbi:Kiwa anti-phage protein KwaB-like domain-containing protein [Marinifilum fragile]|uniref:Kiwa anti-phage protein KwaB-like domain-containing protein n=1 Tax=Marinifilum fragile TaxID=570161 RepID=UPI002AA94D37|nr:Kiwa anti-phage protein KwaB-like domain-containing protein [Marinifilum fragile]
MLEKFFGFLDAIIKEAEASMEVIEQLDILKNPEALKELVEDVTFARKLTKVANSSPFLRKHIPNADIIAFASTYPALKKMRLNADGSKFNLDTKVSKDLFFKLLNFTTNQIIL